VVELPGSPKARRIRLARASPGLRLLLCSSRWFGFVFGGGS
jgi:hypothetical protein